MKLLDRYIARQYLSNIIVLMVILTCFVVTIDFTLNIDRFSDRAHEIIAQNDAAPSQLRTAVITVLLVADLWWPRLLQLFNFILGMILTGAMGFTLSQLVRHRELIAVLASGQSLYRVARPILLVALGLTVLQAVNQEFVLPQLAPLLTRDQGDAGKHELGSAHVPLTRDGLGRVWYAKSFDADTGVLSGVYVWERDPQGRPINRYHAQQAVWNDGGWDLSDGVVESMTDASQPPRAANRIETNLDPTQLRVRRFQGYSQVLSWRQIGQMINAIQTLDPDSPRSKADRDRLERIRWGRISMMLASLLSLVITMPFFLCKTPGNAIVRALRCAPVAIIVLVGGVLGASMTIPGIPPEIGVFLPVLVLMPIAVASITSIKT